MSFFKTRVSFPLNYASSFSVMKHNSYEIFQLKHFMFSTKRTHDSTISQIFECTNEGSPNSSCHFRNHKVRVYSNFVSLFSFIKDNSFVFLQLKPCILWTKKAHRKEILRFLMLYLKSQVSFSLNIASLFNVMRDNSSVLFQLKFYMIWTKGTHQSAKFMTFDC